MVPNSAAIQREHGALFCTEAGQVRFMAVIATMAQHHRAFSDEPALAGVDYDPG